MLAWREPETIHLNDCTVCFVFNTEYMLVEWQEGGHSVLATKLAEGNDSLKLYANSPKGNLLHDPGFWYVRFKRIMYV